MCAKGQGSTFGALKGRGGGCLCGRRCIRGGGGGGSGVGVGGWGRRRRLQGAPVLRVEYTLHEGFDVHSRVGVLHGRRSQGRGRSKRASRGCVCVCVCVGGGGGGWMLLVTCGGKGRWPIDGEDRFKKRKAVEGDITKHERSGVGKERWKMVLLEETERPRERKVERRGGFR